MTNSVVTRSSPTKFMLRSLSEPQPRWILMDSWKHSSDSALANYPSSCTYRASFRGGCPLFVGTKNPKYFNASTFVREVAETSTPVSPFVTTSKVSSSESESLLFGMEEGNRISWSCGSCFSVVGGFENRLSVTVVPSIFAFWRSWFRIFSFSNFSALSSSVHSTKFRRKCLSLVWNQTSIVNNGTGLVDVVDWSPDVVESVEVLYDADDFRGGF